MKHTKKLFALALTLIMALSLTVPALAAEGDITVNNATVGETYTAYKIFDATYDAVSEGVSYTIDVDSAWYADVSAETSPFTLAANASNPGEYYVTQKTGVADKDLLDWLGNASLTGKAVAGTQVAASETVVFAGLEFGYYLVTSSLNDGGVVTIDSNTPSAEIIDKNQALGDITKKVSDRDSAYGDVASVENDGTAYYQIDISRITMYDGVDKVTSYTIYDNMPEGVELNTNTIKVYIDYVTGDAVEDYDELAATEYTLNADSDSFDITLGSETLEDLFANNSEVAVRVKFTATLDAAVADIAAANTNHAYFTWNSKTSTTVDADVYTYMATISKVDASDATKELKGAEFVLYATRNAADGTYSNPVKFTRDANGDYYVDDNGTETLTTTFNDAYKAIVLKGLKDEPTVDGEDVTYNGTTYYLIETKAPEGYNLKADATEFTVGYVHDEVADTWSHVNAAVTVTNSTGTELPSTGGMGTTIFYIVGSVLMVGAAVLLVTKKKMSNEQ